MKPAKSDPRYRHTTKATALLSRINTTDTRADIGYAFVAAEEPSQHSHLQTRPRAALEHGLLKSAARDLRYF